MDAEAQWPQEIVGMEASRAISERRPRQEKDKQVLNCPRCNSTNTKFCYYNNYSLSQPRYFCKTCRRYWTEGGSLRSVPVGGGSRKNKRPSSSSFSLSQSSSKGQIPHHPVLATPNGFPQSTDQNPKNHEGQDLNLNYQPRSCNYIYTPSSCQIPSVELFKAGIASIYSPGFPLQEFKPGLTNFSVDGFGNLQGVQESSSTARLFFPFEDLKLQAPSSGTTAEFEPQNRGEREAIGYWSGMLGGGGSWLA